MKNKLIENKSRVKIKGTAFNGEEGLYLNTEDRFKGLEKPRLNIRLDSDGLTHYFYSDEVEVLKNEKKKPRESIPSTITLNKDENVRVVKEVKHKGYVVRFSYVKCDKTNMGILMAWAFTPEGFEIGEPEFARYLIKNGIAPTKIDVNRKGCCTIGFCKKEQKWYGFGHRGLCGFGVNDKLFDKEWIPEGKKVCDDRIKFTERGSKTITNLEEAKQSAINFADYIS